MKLGALVEHFSVGGHTLPQTVFVSVCVQDGCHLLTASTGTWQLHCSQADALPA